MGLLKSKRALLVILVVEIIVFLAVVDPPERSKKQKVTEPMFAPNSQRPAKGTSPPSIPKADGTIDRRPNDLDELAKDWYFYRRKILEAHHAGDEKAAARYRESFQQVNRWLQEYKESNIQDALSRNDP